MSILAAKRNAAGTNQYKRQNYCATHDIREDVAFGLSHVTPW